MVVVLLAVATQVLCSFRDIFLLYLKIGVTSYMSESLGLDISRGLSIMPHDFINSSIYL